MSQTLVLLISMAEGVLYGWLCTVAASLIIVEGPRNSFRAMHMVGLTLIMVITVVFWIFPFGLSFQYISLVTRWSHQTPGDVLRVATNAVAIAAGIWFGESIYRRAFLEALESSDREEVAHLLRSRSQRVVRIAIVATIIAVGLCIPWATHDASPPAEAAPAKQVHPRPVEVQSREATKETQPVRQPPICTTQGACVPQPGNTGWVMISAVLGVLMVLPGLALFYGGMVRTKNMLSMLMQVFFTVCVSCIIWLIYGYSLAFSEGGALNGFVGGLSKVFLAGVNPGSVVETYTAGVVLPEYAFISFQMAFAAVTPALIVGAMAERIKFSALMLFIPLWLTFVYFPISHMVWYWAGPSAVASAATALASASAEAKVDAQATLDAVVANAGIAFQWGVLDFAGGIVVHISSGIAGLVGALVVGRRVGFGREAMPPHSLTMTMIGASLLWVGWFGLNAGSALEASGIGALAMVNTFAAPAAAAITWMIGEMIFKGKPSLLGGASGTVVGLVAVSPAAGFCGPMGAILLGIVSGFVCLFFVSAIKNALGYDDALDVFGVHCIGGIIGTIGTGILADPSLGGTGIFDYTAGKIGHYDLMGQIIAQIKAVCLALVWSGVGTFAILLIIRAAVGLRAPSDQEREGLDLVDHGERAYNY